MLQNPSNPKSVIIWHPPKPICTLRLHTVRCCSVFVVIWWLIIYPANAAVLISEVIDPLGDGNPAYCDVIAARVWQVDEIHYQLELEVAESIPSPGSTVELMRYSWFLDTDQDPNTGQPHGLELGSEFNIISEQDEQLNFARIGGSSSQLIQLSKFVQNNKIIILVPFARLAEQTSFAFKARAWGEIILDEIDSAGEVVPYTGYFSQWTPQRIVLEEMTRLRDGYVTFKPQLYLQNSEGKPFALSTSDVVEYYAYSDSIDIRDGQILAKPGLIGSTEVVACVNGRLSDNRIVVQLGSLWTDPPVLHLKLPPDPQSESDMMVRVCDAFGQAVSLEDRTVVWGETDAKNRIMLEPVTPTSETVKVSVIPNAFHGLAHVRPTVDGIYAVHGHVRVMADDYSLPTEFNRYWGQEVTFTLPGWLSLSPSEITVDEMMLRYEILAVADAAIEQQRALTGNPGSDARRQFYDAILRDEGFWACGLSGNPIILGFEQGATNPHSCIQVNITGEPHWGVFFHESGHNAVGSNRRINTSFKPAGGSQSPSYLLNEGNATIVSLYAMRQIIQDPCAYTIGSEALESLNSDTSYGGFRRVCNLSLDSLVRFESDPNALEAGGSEVAGMLVTLCDIYGWDKLPRFFSIFLPESDDFGFTVHQNMTFVVACWSAAFGADLRDLCRKWHFVIDDDYFEQILPELTFRAALRDTPVDLLEGNVNTDINK